MMLTILQYQGTVLNPAIAGSLINGATPGVFLLSYICDPGISLDDNDVLFTLEFSYIGPEEGEITPLIWPSDPPEANEYSSPEGIPYGKEPFGSYFLNGSVTENIILVADFTCDSLLPMKNSTVHLTDMCTGGATSWEWSFDRPTVTFVNGTDEHSQNPEVKFTDGGLYTVTLTVSNPLCTATEIKTDYIRAGRLGWWTGETSKNWYTITNWENHLVPNASADIIIPTIESGHFNPRVPGNLITTVDCANIVLLHEAVLEVEGELIVEPGTALIVKGTATVILIKP